MNIAAMKAEVSKFASSLPHVSEGDEHEARVQSWIDELDCMGISADVAELQAHLDRAPDPSIPEADLLRGYIAGLLAA